MVGELSEIGEKIKHGCVNNTPERTYARREVHPVKNFSGTLFLTG
jgi:hypothetical protein